MGPVVETQARRLTRQARRGGVDRVVLSALWPRRQRLRLLGALLLLVFGLLRLWGEPPLDGRYCVLRCVLSIVGHS